MTLEPTCVGLVTALDVSKQKSFPLKSWVRLLIGTVRLSVNVFRVVEAIIFTVRRCVVYAVVMCLSVCLSQAGVVLKRLNTRSRKQRNTIARGF